jgi:hypothetical protein
MFIGGEVGSAWYSSKEEAFFLKRIYPKKSQAILIQLFKESLRVVN